jgi:hypothetical protein
LVVGVIVAPDDVAADHAGLLLEAGVVGAVEREVLQRSELGSGLATTNSQVCRRWGIDTCVNGW